jgi:hypothetical protein
MNDHYQKITVMGDTEDLLKFVNIPLPTKISDFGVENTVWRMTHFHISANMKGQPPYHLSSLAQQNPKIIFAVTAGHVRGPHYRFILNQKTHVPVDISYTTLHDLPNHHQWAERLSLTDTWELIFEKREKSKLMRAALEKKEKLKKEKFKKTSDPIPLSVKKKKALPVPVKKKIETPIIQIYELDEKLNEVVDDDLEGWFK